MPILRRYGEFLLDAVGRTGTLDVPIHPIPRGLLPRLGRRQVGGVSPCLTCPTCPLWPDVSGVRGRREIARLRSGDLIRLATLATLATARPVSGGWSRRRGLVCKRCAALGEGRPIDSFELAEYVTEFSAALVTIEKPVEFERPAPTNQRARPSHGAGMPPDESGDAARIDSHREPSEGWSVRCEIVDDLVLNTRVTSALDDLAVQSGILGDRSRTAAPSYRRGPGVASGN